MLSDDDFQKRVIPALRCLSRRPSTDVLSGKGKLGRQGAVVRRWDGERGTPTEWDGLRRVGVDLSSPCGVTVYGGPSSPINI